MDRKRKRNDNKESRVVSCKSLLLVGRRPSPSLLEVCTHLISANLGVFAARLHLLPLELGQTIYRHMKKRRHFLQLWELEAFCKAFWNPQTLSLGTIEGLSHEGLTRLCFAKDLVRLDLSGCGWLKTLEFLPELMSLRCLNLRNCNILHEDSLKCLYRVPHLECLDLENVPLVLQSSSAFVVAGLKELWALNVSRTSASDGFLETLTYGLKLQKWVEEKKALCSYSGVQGCTRGQNGQGKHLSPVADKCVLAQAESTLREWPSFKVMYLRMEQTKITESAISNILLLRNIILLDCRSTALRVMSFAPVQAIFGLVSSPSHRKLLARSNLILAATLQCACGCTAMEQNLAQSQKINEANQQWLKKWEEVGFLELMQASK